MEPTSLVADARTTLRASSTLGREFAVANALSADEATCWTSAQGSPQQLRLQFGRAVDVSQLQLMFQGGFAGQDVAVHVRRPTGDGRPGTWELETAVSIEPEDSNALQRFPCELRGVDALSLTFARSSDLYGRVVIYRLDVLGNEAEGSPRR